MVWGMVDRFLELAFCCCQDSVCKAKTVLFIFLKEFGVYLIEIERQTYSFSYAGKFYFSSFSSGDKASWEGSD